jgi:hypothetical protein
LPLVSPSRKQPDDDIDDSKQSSSHVVEKDHSKEQLRYLTLGSMAQLTPDSMAQLTPGSTAQLTPGSMAQLTPDSMAQLTPGSMAQLTPGSMAQLKDDSLEKNQQHLSTMPASLQGTACMNSNPSGSFCCVVEKDRYVIFFPSFVSLTLNGRA